MATQAQFTGEVEGNEDGRALSKYISKYLGKELDVGAGRQRYRVGEGSQPECILVDAETPDEGVSLAVSLASATKVSGESHMDKKPIMFVPRWDDGFGPPVILLDWLNKERLQGEPKCS